MFAFISLSEGDHDGKAPCEARDLSKGGDITKNITQGNIKIICELPLCD